jgi:hypothetical protein
MTKKKFSLIVASLPIDFGDEQLRKSIISRLSAANEPLECKFRFSNWQIFIDFSTRNKAVEWNEKWNYIPHVVEISTSKGGEFNMYFAIFHIIIYLAEGKLEYSSVTKKWIISDKVREDAKNTLKVWLDVYRLERDYTQDSKEYEIYKNNKTVDMVCAQIENFKNNFISKPKDERPYYLSVLNSILERLMNSKKFPTGIQKIMDYLQEKIGLEAKN